MGAWLLYVAAAALLAVVLVHRAVRACERANGADWGDAVLNRLDGLNRIFCRKFHRLHADPVPLPPEGGALVVANHVSGLDPMLMIAACPRPLRFIIAREQYERWWLKWFFRWIRLIPLERERNPRKALYAARRALEAGEVVALFPQGAIQAQDRPVRLKRGVTVLAAMTGAPIYPLRLEGIRGRGRIVGAVFLRSRARIRAFAPLYCSMTDAAKALARLQACLSGARDAESKPRS